MLWKEVKQEIWGNFVIEVHKGIEVYAGSRRENGQKDRIGGKRHSEQWKQGKQRVVKDPGLFIEIWKVQWAFS